MNTRIQQNIAEHYYFHILQVTWKKVRFDHSEPP